MPALILITLFLCVISSSPGMLAVIPICFSMNAKWKWKSEPERGCRRPVCYFAPCLQQEPVVGGGWRGLKGGGGASGCLLPAWLVECHASPRGLWLRSLTCATPASTNNRGECKPEVNKIQCHVIDPAPLFFLFFLEGVNFSWWTSPVCWFA